MGEQSRPAPQRQIPYTHSLCDRHIDCRPSAQPLVYTGNRARDILPSVEGHIRNRLAHHACSISHCGGAHPLRTRPRVHRGITVFRTLLCQHFRVQLQRRRALLCHPCRGIIHMGDTRAVPTDKRKTHTLERCTKHPALRNPVHRQQHVDSGGDNGRGDRLPVLVTKALCEDTQPCSDEHLRNLHRLLKLRTSAHTFVS